MNVIIFLNHKKQETQTFYSVANGSAREQIDKPGKENAKL